MNIKKITKYLLIVFSIFLVFAYFGSKELYNKNYDSYYQALANSYVIDAADNNTLQLKINISTELIEYHHLGKDITEEFTCNGEHITDGSTISAQSCLEFTATITEHDTIDDVGRNTVSLSTPPYNNSIKSTVRVKERGGKKYKNAYAVYEITYSTEPVIGELQIDYWDVVFYQQ